MVPTGQIEDGDDIT